MDAGYRSIEKQDMAPETRKRIARDEFAHVRPKATSPPDSNKRRNPYVDEAKLFGRNSRLVARRTHSLFVNPESWDLLKLAEREHLSKLLPPSSLDADGRPSSYFLKHNVDWRTSIREFQEDLSGRRYEPEWLSDALNAARQRRCGELDSWKDLNFEQFWGQKSDHLKPAPSAEASPTPPAELSRLLPTEANEPQIIEVEQIQGVEVEQTLPAKDEQILPLVLNEPPPPDVDDFSELVQQGFLRLGDVWTYSRLISPNNGADSILVEKEIRLSRIDNDGKILFSIPRGHQKAFAHPLPPLPRKPLPSSGSRANSPMTSPVRTAPASPQRYPERASMSVQSPLRRPQRQPGGSTLDTMAGREIDATTMVNDGDFDSPAVPLTAKTPNIVDEVVTSQASASVLDATNLNGAIDLRNAIQVLTASLEVLQVHVLEIDGRCNSATGAGTDGNAWKHFRCRHENKDVGTLWDVLQRRSASPRKL